MDNVIEARRPDIVVIDKTERKAQIIDVAVPVDKSSKQKQNEKIEKYQNLKSEVMRLWKLRTAEVTPVVVGALGTVPRDQKKYLDWLELGDKATRQQIQKAAVLGTARILRRVLSLPGDRQ